MTGTAMPDLTVLLAAARALGQAGQWDLADSLLAACPGDDPRVLLARADHAVWREFWQDHLADDALAAVAAAQEHGGWADSIWHLNLLTLRRDYLAAVAPADGDIRVGADQHSAPLRADLTDRAAGLYRTAPGATAQGWAAFWRGAIADNVAGDAAMARACYHEAHAAGAGGIEDELAAEALRHLGSHARREGDHAEARRLWERATALRQRAGAVPGVLSQQLVLARNAADTGDRARAAAIAVEVSRWADSLGLARLAAQARCFQAWS
jgi:hypothetical protein